VPQEISGRIIINPPKTRAGHRRVHFPKVVNQALVQLNEETRWSDPHDFVFTAPLGGAVRLPAWRARFWTPATKRAGVAPLRIHDLRHTAVAFWISVGASPNEIAARAGHSSVVTVLDRYGHLLPGDEDKVSDALDALAATASETGPADSETGRSSSATRDQINR
jgi:integrase